MWNFSIYPGAPTPVALQRTQFEEWTASNLKYLEKHRAVRQLSPFLAQS